MLFNDMLDSDILYKRICFGKHAVSYIKPYHLDNEFDNGKCDYCIRFNVICTLISWVLAFI